MLLKETTAFKEQVTKEEENIKQELEALETKMAQLNTVRMADMDIPIYFLNFGVGYRRCNGKT